jgi:hypothetical protein
VETTMPRYEDVKLEKRPLSEDHPCYEESRRLSELSSCYDPDESKTFMENLKLKFIFDLRRQTLNEIRHLKSTFYRETGEFL